jgi:hypothetical protein
MLTAVVAFGLQALLLNIGAHWTLSLAFSAALLGEPGHDLARRARAQVLGPGHARPRRRPLCRARLHFASEWVYRGYLAERYALAQKEIDQATVMLQPKGLDVRQLSRADRAGDRAHRASAGRLDRRVPAAHGCLSAADALDGGCAGESHLVERVAGAP